MVIRPGSGAGGHYVIHSFMVSSASARANPENARTGFAVLDSAGEKIRAEQDSCIKSRDLSTCMQLDGKISRTCVAFAGLQIIPAGCVAPSMVVCGHVHLSRESQIRWSSCIMYRALRRLCMYIGVDRAFALSSMITCRIPSLADIKPAGLLPLQSSYPKNE